MKIKKTLLALLCAVTMLLGIGVTPVFAQTNESAESNVCEDVQPEEPAEPTEPEEPENLDPLTPEGNLTLVDDITSEKTGKQFITVISRNGNYFYIIIDRDDEGENTVHFLNQVDEADLLNLMDEDEAQAILDADAKEAAEKAAQEQAAREAAEAASKAETEQVTEEKKPVNWIPMAVCVMLAGIGVVVFFLIRMKKKTDPAEQFPDPDANYSEEDDGYDLQEEADEENSEEDEEE